MMQIPVQITLRGMPGSPALQTAIVDRAARLEHIYEHILSCRVAVELETCGIDGAGQFKVRIGLKVPGQEIVVDQDRNRDVYLALRGAFDAARRQLERFRKAARTRAV